MKCQKCEKPATFHITELTEDEVSALHYCADCAEVYLKPSETSEEIGEDLGAALTKHLKIGQTAEELHRLDQKKCPVCEISFYEFRQSGRLGCPHDYEVFQEELHPLLETIHSETTHCGKVPKRAPGASQQRVQIIKLRNDLKRAIAEEHFEDAASLRDQIHNLEQPLPE